MAACQHELVRVGMLGPAVIVAKSTCGRTGQVHGDIQTTIAEPVPLHLRNAVTGLMGNLGYGRGYQYAHNREEKVTDMTCLPASLAGRTYYKPTDQGFEARLRQRMDEIRKIQKKPAGERSE